MCTAQENLLGAVGDSNPFIRSAVGSCVTTVFTAGGFEAWPQLFPTLYSLLDSTDQGQLEGAYGALHKICEDSADALALQVGTPALSLLIPKFLADFQSPHEFVRKMALGCVNQFVQVMAEPLANNLDTYLNGLFALAVDPSPEVRKRVCQALVILLDVHLECLLPHLKHVIEYMLLSTKVARTHGARSMAVDGGAGASAGGAERQRVEVSHHSRVLPSSRTPASLLFALRCLSITLHLPCAARGRPPPARASARRTRTSW